MRRILYIIFIETYCNITVPLVKHGFITKWPYMEFHILCSVVKEHDFISDFIVKVNSMFILAGVISINLRLFLLTY